MPHRRHHLKVFLCHASGDKPQVRALYERLIADGVDAWLDKKKLLPGSDWELEIRKAVREADVVVVCLSKQFNEAGFRQKEVRLALDTAMEQPEGEIFIIPARLEECDNLESLRKWHWVDLFEEDGYQSLIRALRARANRIGATLHIRRLTTPRPKEIETSPPIQPEVKTTEPKKPFTIKLIFTLFILVILVYITYTYLFQPNNQTMFTCTPPTMSAIGLSIALWFLVNLGWYYLEKPVKNPISTIPTGQQNYRMKLTRILILPSTLFLWRQLSKKHLIFLTIAWILFTSTIWGLNWSGIQIFYIEEETPQVFEFLIDYSNGVQYLKPGDTVEVIRGQQFLVTASHQPVNVICSWFSAERGDLVLESPCSTLYGPLLVTGNLDSITLKLQSACQTKSVFTSLNVKIREP